ncbi:cysteine desulfurase NifS [Pueribacillus theae]|uniref:cysteine desulfurase n=1 Tax=Pueribacillus theae TaxID=2171751 RepID=A0A2U1K4U5_9BACI|nr:cysteine desulfurase family protein [Pueribacillus theae]PWA12530.1 cysteine desulfurase NifS [Pueribacillus theae]
MEAIYVDHAATSPMYPEVIDTMLQVFQQNIGNPSSIHRFGREARRIIDEARNEFAKSINAKENEIILTSGGTESDNLAILGTALSEKGNGRHIITSAIEHHAVLHPCEYLGKQGFEVTYLPVDEHGKVRAEDVKSAVRDDTVLVTIMYGNNEVGTVQPIKEIGAFLKNTSAYFHTDAVQAYGLYDLDVQSLGVDLLSVSAHKMNGPKGAGFLYAREGVQLAPLILGGEQERKRRAGTENVAAIAGFHTAVQLMNETMEEKQHRYRSFQNRMLAIFEESGIEYVMNGSKDERLPHILNVSFPGTTAEALLVNLDLSGVAASSGSACTAGSLEPSHVLGAMFNDQERINSAIRFSFGLGNKMEHIEKAALETVRAVKQISGR